MRAQIAFYGSTPNYAFIFEQLGREGTTDRIRERMKAGDMDGMAAVIDDDLLEHFCVTGTFAEVADGLVDRYGGLAARLVLYSAGSAWQGDRSALGAWGEMARDVASRTEGGER